MFSIVTNDALNYHRYPSPGKFKTLPSKPLNTQHDLALAYSPGVADACEEIIKNPAQVNELTIRRHLVAVITNGTAVLGLGDIGPLAAKPVMEGKSVLFQQFARLQSIDLEIDERDPHKLIDIIASLAPTFGGINLEDIKAPECFIVEKGLQKRLSIPVFHDDQHGTAITVAAGLLNALSIVGKSLESARFVISGAGASAIACINLLMDLGLKKENFFVADSLGIIYQGRADLADYKIPYAQKTEIRHLSQAIKNADVFLGLSRKEVLTQKMVADMAKHPIIFALANPTPEIFPHEILAVRSDALIGTGRSDYSNQINNLLCFPYIFRGALDAEANHINQSMKMACVRALAKLAQQGFSDVLGHYNGENTEFGNSYFIPKPFDPRLLTDLPLAVAEAAINSGIATRTFCIKDYKKTLIQQAYQGLPAFCTALLHPKKELPEIFYEEVSPMTLSAAQTLKRYKIAIPGFIGDPECIRKQLSSYHLLNEAKILQPMEVTSEHRCVRNFIGINPITLKGYKKEGATLFFLSEAPNDLSQVIKIITILGFIPYVVSAKPYESSIKVYSSLPEDLQEGVGYLILGQERITKPNIGPFIISQTPRWQTFSEPMTLQDLLERSVISILMD